MLCIFGYNWKPWLHVHDLCDWLESKFGHGVNSLVVQLQWTIQERKDRKEQKVNRRKSKVHKLEGHDLRIVDGRACDGQRDF